MSARVSVAVLALGLVLASPVSASDTGYLYGRVETVDGGTYEGQLRWGTEESFWDDIFNANKTENENLDFVDRREIESRNRRYGIAWDLFGIGDHSLEHLFAIRFGDLKRIRVRHGDDLIVEFRNGEDLRLKGGSNDVGAEITVVDAKQGIHELDWDRIRTIEFMETPAVLRHKLGDPIYGTVKCGRLEFTGRIQWDNDECLSIDELDGHTRDGKASIEFGDIASIRKHRHGSLVTLKTGSELFLTGTNDVNHDNRGVVVVVPRVGTVKVGWDDFDESKDFEMLHGQNGDTEYLIPFRNIARITPKGRWRSEVALHMGLTLELEESQDVSRNNDGLLVFTGERKPKYVPWRSVTDVKFAATSR